MKKPIPADYMEDMIVNGETWRALNEDAYRYDLQKYDDYMKRKHTRQNAKIKITKLF